MRLSSSTGAASLRPSPFRLLPTIYCLLATVCVLLAACSAAPSALEATPTPYPTPERTTYTVERGDLLVERKLEGRVTPLAAQTLYFALDGRVGSVYVQMNDTVTAGQLLADLEELKALESEWAAASAELQSQQTEIQRGLRRLEIDLEIAQLTLEQYKAEGRSEYELKIQQLQVELAQITLDEAKALAQGAAGGTNLAEIEAKMQQAQLFAPAAGQVLAVVTPGRAVRSTTAAFVIGDASQLEVSADVEEDLLKLLSEGLPVTVTPDSRPDLKLSGTIRLLPYPYGSGPGEDRSLHIALDQPPSADTYQNGEKVSIRLILADQRGVLLLPPSAVRQAAGRTFVIMDSGSGPKRVDVQLGLQTSERVEILSGLTEGQTVIAP